MLAISLLNNRQRKYDIRLLAVPRTQPARDNLQVTL